MVWGSGRLVFSINIVRLAFAGVIWVSYRNLTRKGLYCRHDHSAAAEYPSVNCSSPLVANWAWEFLASVNAISQRDFRSCGGDHVLLQASVFEDCMQR